VFFWIIMQLCLEVNTVVRETSSLSLIQLGRPGNLYGLGFLAYWK
jgi:hypothetical protein